MGKSISNTFWACKEHTHNSTLRCAICDEQHIAKLEAQLEEQRLDWEVNARDRIEELQTQVNDMERMDYPCKKCEELETLLNEYKGAECRALKSQGEALVMIEQLQAQLEQAQHWIMGISEDEYIAYTAAIKGEE